LSLSLLLPSTFVGATVLLSVFRRGIIGATLQTPAQPRRKKSSIRAGNLPRSVLLIVQKRECLKRMAVKFLLFQPEILVHAGFNLIRTRQVNKKGK